MVPPKRKKACVLYKDTLAHQEKNLARLANFRLMDDTFMSEVLSGATEAVALILNIILERNDLVVISAKSQEVYHSALMHSVRLDIVAMDAHGDMYDIEVQNTIRDDLVKRARYNSSMLDTRLLNKGDLYTDLRETYVIFITEEDFYKQGLPMYHIDRHVKEMDADYEDGAHIIFVNGQYQDQQEPIGRLMHDFHCSNAEDVLYPQIKERIRYFKEEEKGVNRMCRIMEEMCREAAEEAAKEAEKANSLKIAHNMILNNIPIETIAQCTGLTLREVEGLRKEILVNA